MQLHGLQSHCLRTGTSKGGGSESFVCGVGVFETLANDVTLTSTGGCICEILDLISDCLTDAVCAAGVFETLANDVTLTSTGGCVCETLDLISDCLADAVVPSGFLLRHSSQLQGTH